MFYFIFLVVILFSVVHLIEVSAFFSRLSGVISGYTALGYALQNSVFMLTRVFTMALFPLLGFIVDAKIPQAHYILMVSISLLLAALFGFFIILLRRRVVSAFCEVIEKYNKKGSLFVHLLFLPFFFIRSIVCNMEKGEVDFRSSFFVGGFFVFGIYSISVFLSFFFGLVFYEYRATITQLSGISNAIATIVLTFYIEPRLSSIIDKDRSKAASSLSTLMAGRVAGTFSFGVCFFGIYLLAV